MVNFFIERQKCTAQYYSEDLGNNIKLDMVLIPEGKFIMGAPESDKDSEESERPQHEVTVLTFFMGRYPITQEQWQAVMGENPSRSEGDQRPVEKVSWNKTREFCQRLSELSTRKYRLPSEAEWEYAARAVSSKQLSPFEDKSVDSKKLEIEEWNRNYYQPFNCGETLPKELANFSSNKTTPVGKFPANNFGLCDMHGNVWEWCEDDWHDNYENALSNGSALVDEKSDYKVLRGGAWDFFPDICRSASRDFDNPGIDDYTFGFRVVCEVPRTL